MWRTITRLAGKPGMLLDPVAAVGTAKMTARTTESYARALRNAQEFSLVHGGPLFQLLLRSHLSSDSLTLVTRRVIVFVLITWVPLLALAAHDGHLLDGNVAVPFLLDVETHI